MLRNAIIALVVGTVLATAVPSADARPSPRAQKFQANKSFGLGVMFGAPTAISGKYFLSQDTALDFGVGTFYRYRDGGLHLHADFLWHPAVLVKADAFWLPLYFGIGGRFLDHGNHGHLGARVPIGIAFDFTNVPLDIFLELAAVLDFALTDDDHGVIYGDVNGAVGIRYWF
jgi:hypothetical protein